jgi:mono/diheme cytochrome c family protein
MGRLTAVLLVLATCKPKAEPGSGSLTFVHDGKTVRTLSIAELEKSIAPETVTGFDPYYGKTKTFHALALGEVLKKGFEGEGADLASAEYVFRAKDGYAAPFRGALATEPGGYIAFEDVDAPGWELIGPQHANPAPFYVVWKKTEQANLESHPRPWQLQTIEMARFDAIYPHTSPGTPEGSPASKGYAIFREQCIRCHAINREGGHVGPDLNVAQNILEYRPEAQVRAYIKNPLAFRYSTMPAHPNLSDGDLDSLIAYFAAMKDRKHDSGN